MFVGETDDKLSQFSLCKDDLSTIIKESCDNWLTVCLNKMLTRTRGIIALREGGVNGKDS